MASKAFLIALAGVAAIVAPTRAKEIVVGGKDGWMFGMDYQAWADGIEFHVGDTLGMSKFLESTDTLGIAISIYCVPFYNVILNSLTLNELIIISRS